MDIKYIETKQPGGPDGNNNYVLFCVDGKTSISIHGYGCSKYKLSVHDINTYEDLLDKIGVADNESFWGTALTWAEPLTIAHLVMDVINNQ